jgi:tryptophanyl-tRNA synthetase
MSAQQKVMLSGITPSARPTIGNYIGALKNWVRLQHDYHCVFFVADLHAITTRQDPEFLRKQTYEAIALYIASGLDPEKVTLCIQSHVPHHAELGWILNCFTYMGELNRMTQFKDKSDKQGQNIPAGLYNYPTLMAADILVYQSNLVPVGEDQKQHIELTRDIAIRMNNLYGKDLFTVPEVFIPPVGARIMSLQNPQAKMSKSDEDPNATVFLTDTNDQIIKKFKRAVTDSGSEITFDDSKPGIKNLITIQAAMTGKSIQDVVTSYVGKQYGHLKLETADIVAQSIAPVRDRALEMLKDTAYLDSVLKKGAEKARIRAAATVSKVYERVGFITPSSH